MKIKLPAMLQRFKINLRLNFILIYVFTGFGIAQAQAPGAPTNLVVTPINTGGMIQFMAPSSAGGSAITNYEYSTDNGATWVTPSPAVTETPLFISSGLTNCTTYQVKIRAVNASGSGTASAAASLTPNASSIDGRGTTWKQRLNIGGAAIWGIVTYGNGLFVAAVLDNSSTANSVATSPDGVTWTLRSSAVANSWTSFTYGNGLFVAVARTGTGNRVMTSPDGITWTARASAADNDWQGVTYGNGLFVAVAGTGNGNRIMTSPDGINWTLQTTPTPPLEIVLMSVTYGNGLFVAVGSNSNGIYSSVMTSPDGINWTIQTAPVNTLWVSVTYGNGLFVAVARDVSTGGSLTSTPTYPVITSPDGINWTTRSTPGNNNWKSVTYGNGQFVAVAEAGTSGQRVITSQDGITWSAQTSASDLNWYAVTYGNGIFVALAATSANGLMTSGFSVPASTPVISDGIPGNSSARVDFTQPTSSVYAPAISNYEYSTDNGSTWTARSPASASSSVLITGLSNGTTYNIKLRAINEVGASCESSASSVTPANTTTVPSVPTNLTVTPINTGGILQFTAPSSDGGSTITNYQYSTDNGATWVTPSPAVTASPVIISSGLTNCTSYQVKIRAVNAAGSGAASASADLTPLLSTDERGTTWRSRTTTTGLDNNWRGITYGNGLYVAVGTYASAAQNPNGNTTNRVMTSPDGITWTPRAAAAQYLWSSVTYGNGRFVAVAQVGANNNNVMTSTDGITWTLGSLTSTTWYSVTYGNGRFVAVATSGAVVTSDDDGATWTSRNTPSEISLHSWTSVTYGNGLFVAVAQSGSGTGNRAMWSADGINWTTGSTPSENQWRGITYGNGLFVAVSTNGTGNRVMTSPDGITWTSRTSATDNDWNSITYGDGLFVAVGNYIINGNSSTRVMTSPNGINWTAQTSAATNNWQAVTYTNGNFVAVSNSGSSNRVMTSGISYVANAPVITSATLGTTSTINFTQSSSVYAPAISNYEYSTDNGSNWTALSPAATTSPITISGLSTVPTQIRLRAVNSIGNSCFSNNYSLIRGWIGTSSNDWNTGSNWSGGVAPSSGNAVTIPTGLSNYPVLSGAISLSDLTLESGSSLNLSTYNLTLSGNLTNNGTISGSGILSLSGTSAQTVSGTGSVKHITVNNAAGVTVASGSNKLNVLGVLTPTAGTITTNGNLVLKSTATEEGTIGAVATCPTNPFSGDVTVERYIPANQRSYRFLTPGVTTTTSINANWQEGATSSTNNPNPGYGTHITGSISGANGLDATLTGNASLYSYSADGQAWSAITNTLTPTFKAGEGYQLMVRGSRAIDLTTNTPTPDNTVIRSTGTLSVCDVSFTSSSAVPLSNAATGWSFIGNPYWSIVDLTTVTKTNIESTYYYWDPTLTGTNNRGAYATLTIDGVGGETPNNLSSQVSKYLQPGQGFFIRNTSSSPSLTFKESDKVTSAANKKLIFQKNPVGAGMELGAMDNARVRGNGSSVTEKVYLSLFIKEKLNVSPADGFALAYNSRYKNTQGAEDAAKFTNPDENIAAMYNSTRFSILGMQTGTGVNSDTIPIAMWNLNDRDYVLQFNLTQYVDPQREIFLLNRTTGQTTKVGNTGTFDYAFRPVAGVRTKDDLAIVFNTARIAPKPRSRKDLVVFPNPTTTGVVQFSIPNTTGKLNLSQGAQAEVFDATGRSVMIGDVEMVGGSVGQLDLTNLSDGAYTMKVTIGGQVFMTKVIKQ